MDTAKNPRPTLYDRCFISPLLGLNLNFYAMVFLGVIALSASPSLPY